MYMLELYVSAFIQGLRLKAISNIVSKYKHTLRAWIWTLRWRCMCSYMYMRVWVCVFTESSVTSLGVLPVNPDNFLIPVLFISWLFMPLLPITHPVLFFIWQMCNSSEAIWGPLWSSPLLTTSHVMSRTFTRSLSSKRQIRVITLVLLLCHRCLFQDSNNGTSPKTPRKAANVAQMSSCCFLLPSLPRLTCLQLAGSLPGLVSVLFCFVSFFDKWLQCFVELSLNHEMPFWKLPLDRWGFRGLGAIEEAIKNRSCPWKKCHIPARRSGPGRVEPIKNV